MKRFRRTLACAVALIALVGVFAVQPVDLGAQEACPKCQDGELEGEDVHQFVHWLGADHFCEPGSYGCHYNFAVLGFCGDYHELCEPSQDAVDALATALTVESPALFQKALGDYPDVLILDPATRSVQLLGCGGETAAKFSVPDWGAAAVLPS